MPGAVSALDEAKLPIRPVAVIEPDALPTNGSSLNSEFSNRTVAFTYGSFASRDGQTISVTQTVKFVRLSSHQTEVSAPYVGAMRDVKTLNEEEVLRFASSIREMKNRWTGADGQGKTVSTRIGSGPSLFIVNHPITVRTEDEIFCLSVKSYSLIPVAAGPNYCGSR
jgi:hypothetical protein